MALPVVPSSPGAVQVRVTEFWVRLEVERLVIWLGAVVSGVACTAYDFVILAAQQFLDVPVMASHLEVYEPVVNPVQLNTALFPE